MSAYPPIAVNLPMPVAPTHGLNATLADTVRPFRAPDKPRPRRVHPRQRAPVEFREHRGRHALAEARFAGRVAGRTNRACHLYA